MIATKTVARILQKEFRKQKKGRKNLSWFMLASVARTAMMKSLKKRGTVLKLVNKDRL